MMLTISRADLLRVASGLLLALTIIFFALVFPMAGRAQSTTTGATQSAIPTVTTTTGMLNATAATGHNQTVAATNLTQTITLPGASAKPLVHASFEGGTPATRQAVSYQQGSVRSLNSLDRQSQNNAYHYAASSDATTTQSEHPLLLSATHAPTFSAQPGDYAGSLTVSIVGENRSTNIFYTLNGDAPSRLSAMYTRPLTLTETATLRAIAINSGDEPSPITAAAYRILQPKLTLEVDSNGQDTLELFVTLDAPGAASLSGNWTVTDGTQTICRLSQETATTLHCAAKAIKGEHTFKATYAGSINGWQLQADSRIQVN